MSQENIAELIAREFADHAGYYNIRPGAASDVIRRALALKPSLTSTGEIVFPGGRDLAQFAVSLRETDGRHLFARPAPPPAPEAKPDVTSWTAEARLGFANGDKPHPLPRRRLRPRKDGRRD